MFNTFRMMPQISRWIFHLFIRSFLDYLNGQSPIVFFFRKKVQVRRRIKVRVFWLWVQFGPAIGRLHCCMRGCIDFTDA